MTTSSNMTAIINSTSNSTSNMTNPAINYNQFQTDNYYLVDPHNDINKSLGMIFSKMKDSPGTIILPDKPFILTSPITLKDGQCLKGVGNNTEIRALNINGPAIFFSNHCNISNIKLIGNGADRSIGIQNNENTAAFQFDNLTITGFKKGILLSNCWVGLIINVFIDGNDVGMVWQGFVNAIQIIGGHYGGNRIGIQSLPGAMLLKNTITTTIEGNSEMGIYINSTSTALSIRDCYFELNGDNAGGPGGDIVIDSGMMLWGTTIDGCFGVRSMPMIHIKGGRGTKISNCTGWVKNFIKIEAEAVDTIVDHNIFYTHVDYDTCVGILDNSSTTRYTQYQLGNIPIVTTSLPVINTNKLTAMSVREVTNKFSAHLTDAANPNTKNKINAN